jgi:hypothetical protein
MNRRKKPAKHPAPTRLARWKNVEFVTVFSSTWDDGFSELDTALAGQIADAQIRFQESSGEKIESASSFWNMIRSCRELIYDVVDGKPAIHCIAQTINVRRGQLQIGPFWEFIIEGNTPEERDEDVRLALAFAHSCEVPVFPNRDDLTDELADHYRKLMVDGFSERTSDGKRARFRLVESPGSAVGSLRSFQEMTLTRPRHPAEFALIRKAVVAELAKLNEAKRLLGALELALAELSKLLSSRRRNENSLQRCLTRNPILFGLEYRRIIPKHRLGSDFEMDYALERSSGLVDLVELESANLPLFTKKGDPSQHLIHAEQQVFDWLLWIEKHHEYARAKLPRVMRPVGFVVIGRSAGLDDAGKNRLLMRNSLFHDSVQIVTYDDLLERARTMFNVLCGSEAARTGPA